MSVRSKLFICLAGLGLLLWGSTAFLASKTFLGRFDKLDEQRVERTLSRVREGIMDQKSQMASALGLWLSDRSRASVTTHAEAFIQEFQLNLLAVISPAGRVEQKVGHRLPSREARLTAGDEAALVEVCTNQRAEKKSSGLISLSLGPAIYATALMPDGATVLVAALVNGDYEEELRRVFLSDLLLLPATGALMENFRGLAASEQLSLVPQPGPADETVSAYALLRDAWDEPLLVLKVSEARHSYIDGMANLRFFLGLTAAFAVGTVILATFIVEFLVTGRIRRLTNSARRADAHAMDDLSAAFLNGSDEVASLARATKAMVDRLKKSQLLYRAVVETQNELIVRYKPDGEITLANEAFARFFGRHIKGVVGRNLTEFFQPANLKGGGILEQLPDSNHRTLARDLEFLDADGQIHWIQWNQRALFEGGQQLTEIQATGHDVTMRLEYERNLKRAKDAAERANAAKEEFLAVMSHEMRTPLASILGFASILENTPLDESQQEYLQLIRSSGNDLLMLLHDLLDYSNVASGEIELHPETIDVAVLLREVVATQRAEAHEKGLDIDLDQDIDTPEIIEVDSGRLRQILHNIVSNGIKFTDRGFVRISAKGANDGFIEFVVQDTGIGIAEEAQASVFHAFGVADASNSRSRGGAGIGLAVSRKLVERMGGTISMESRPGLGTIVRVTLPVGQPDPTAIKAAVESTRRAAEAGKESLAPRNLKALVVDDNNVNLKVLCRMLEQIGISSVAATSGRQCLDSLAKSGKNGFDLVFMDIQMPEMDGFETVARIRRLEAEGKLPRHHIIACTAFALPGDRQKCLQAGLDDYLSKPVRLESLREAVERGTTEETAAGAVKV